MKKSFVVDVPTDLGVVVDCVEGLVVEVARPAATKKTNVAGRATSISPLPNIITLTGDLGAGKTTFVQQLALKLGITEVVTSPTFGIMKRYDVPNHPNFTTLVHIDAYRIEGINETIPLQLESVFREPQTLVCVEWPERIAEIIPVSAITVTLEITTGDTRKVCVSVTCTTPNDWF